MSKKAQSNSFPEILYVVVEEEGTENEFLYPVSSLEEVAIVGKVRQVAVYHKDGVEDIKAVVQIVG